MNHVAVARAVMRRQCVCGSSVDLGSFWNWSSQTKPVQSNRILEYEGAALIKLVIRIDPVQLSTFVMGVPLAWVEEYEAIYFRQNILNLSLNLGLDVSAENEKERGRIRSFEELEFEAFKRVKREVFRDMPYLLIIDNLETEQEWLHNVMNFYIMQLPSLPLSDAMTLVRGRRKKDYLAYEFEFLRKFDEKLGRLSFGLWIIGAILSELPISPSALFEAVNRVSTSLEDGSTTPTDQQFCKHNPFLMKILCFCFAVLHQGNGRRNSILASRMLLVGAWFAPSPITANFLATAAKCMSVGGKRFKMWVKCRSLTFSCFGGCGLATQSDKDCVNLLVKLGLARRANGQNGCWIQLHPITQAFAKRKERLLAAKATILGLKAIDMLIYISRRRYYRWKSRSLSYRKYDWCEGSLCWRNELQGKQRVDEYVWQDVTLLKATLLETKAKLLLKGGHFDSREEL
ncbi:zinc transporter 11-like [Hibiscus syriacus]|uniref:Zinc transporter 11-like n=1 Tax=Hibiscus syriacus TaxID=106335 RepID=A0A6A3CHS8_HIBSY|nr:zinc transporter 11-like [Hibiscus syriacus]